MMILTLHHTPFCIYIAEVVKSGMVGDSVHQGDTKCMVQLISGHAHLRDWRLLWNKKEET
jgi:hypothetical protein